MRAAHLGAGRPHSSKKPKLSSSRGLPHNARGGGREEKKRSAGWSPVRPVHVPHPSMSTFLQSLMKVNYRLFVVDSFHKLYYCCTPGPSMWSLFFSSSSLLPNLDINKGTLDTGSYNKQSRHGEAVLGQILMVYNLL